jgi:PIN domain nuclease of toxin-antitoxin system
MQLLTESQTFFLSQNGGDLMAEVTPGKGEPAVRISAVWIAEQFAEIRTTLGFVREQIEKQAVKEAAQDVEIEGLRKDIAEIKADVRSIKESKPPRVSPVIVMTAVVASAGFVLALLNQLYGGV